jgi:hypothetical protein
MVAMAHALELSFACTAAGAIGLAMTFFGTAAAAPVTYTANLTPVPLNGATSATGKVTLILDGNQATITEQVSGLAATFMNAPYPHVQHIHGGAMGVCPAANADSDKDGVISTTEGQPAYGEIQTTLSLTGDTTPAAGTNIQIAPTGATFNYSRTITLDQATVTSITTGKAVIVVHGLDPASAAPAATSSKSELVPTLPLAATSPALCGTLTASAGAPPAAAAPAAPAPAPTNMRPPTTGDAGLLDSNSSGTNWSLAVGAAFVVALGLVGTGTFVATRHHSR